MNKETLKYRVIKLCFWVDRPEDEFDIEVLGSFDSVNAATARICVEVCNELETLNGRKYSLDIESLECIANEDRFRADFDGDNSCSIMCWDGDDYRYVTIYNVYELSEEEKGERKEWMYRGYKIFCNQKQNRFSVITMDYTPIKTLLHTLSKALLTIDDICCRRLV